MDIGAQRETVVDIRPNLLCLVTVTVPAGDSCACVGGSMWGIKNLS